MLTLFCFLQLAGQEHPVVQKSFDKIPWKTGSHTYSVKNQYGKKWDMRISFPKKDVNPSGVPLIIALHWAGSGDTFEIFHDCLVVPGTKDLDAILVSPEGEDQLWNTLNNINKVKDILNYAKAHWNVDKTRILVLGYSNGGIGAWYHAENNPQWFSAAIPMASYYAPRNPITIPIYAIHGAKDELFPVEKMRNWVNNARKKGSTITFAVNDNLSHKEACNYVSELEKAVDWVVQTVWIR